MTDLMSRATPIDAPSSSGASSDEALFYNALAAAVDLLRDLPRSSDDTDDARQQLAAFAAAHPAARPEFFVDIAPGDTRADFDVYLTHPAGGTVGVSFRPDTGRPWFVDYSQHWAAGYMLHVGAADVTVQEGLFAIQYLAEQRHDVLTPLLRDALLQHVVADDLSLATHPALEVTPADVQQAADAFRRRHHLESAESTHAWLEQMGWSIHRFRSVLANGVLCRKLEDLVVGDRIEPDFAARRADYEIIMTARVACATEDLARRLAADAASAGLLAAAQQAIILGADAPPAGVPDSAGAAPPDLRLTTTTSRRFELDDTVARAGLRAVIGPRTESASANDHEYVVTQVLWRVPAVLDAATRRVVRERLLSEWVQKRLRTVPVRWNWR